MVLANGTGSEFRQPLGWAIIGGLTVSQVLTLFTTPVIYIYLDRLRRKPRAGPAAATKTTPQQRALRWDPRETEPAE
jgi:hypothetical protein